MCAARASVLVQPTNGGIRRSKPCVDKEALKNCIRQQNIRHADRPAKIKCIHGTDVVCTATLYIERAICLNTDRPILSADPHAHKKRPRELQCYVINVRARVPIDAVDDVTDERLFPMNKSVYDLPVTCIAPFIFRAEFDGFWSDKNGTIYAMICN